MMKRSLLLVVSVLVAAVGTAVVAIWALGMANKNDSAGASGAASAEVSSSSSPTPTAAPTTVPPSQNGYTVNITGFGLAPGQWIDVMATKENKAPIIRWLRVAVMAVPGPNQAVLALDPSQVEEMETFTSSGWTLVGLLRNPNDPVDNSGKTDETGENKPATPSAPGVTSGSDRSPSTGPSDSGTPPPSVSASPTD